MSFFKNFFGYVISQKSFKQDDTPPTLHSSLNWTNSVVAGSYALKQFTGDTHWNSNDIDVMVACQTKEEFELEAQRFSQLSKMELIKEAWFGVSGLRGSTIDELFHERVMGSKTYSCTNYDKTIQLICLRQNFQGEHPSAILNETSDIPACVSYSMMGGARMFHIPEKGRQIIMTRQGNKSLICPLRLLKYEERGYKFS